MKVLQLKTSSGRGGAETLMFALTKQLVARGHSVKTLFGEPGWLLDRFSEEGFDAGLVDLRYSRLFSESTRIARLLKRPGYDCVLAHGARANLVGSLGGVLAKVPSVCVEHSVDSWRGGGGIQNKVDRVLGHLNARRIAVSGAVRNMLAELNIIDASRIVLVPNAIEISKRVERSNARRAVCQFSGFSEDDFIVLTVARLVPAKGHTFLLQAVARHRQEVPRLRLVFCGDGELRLDLEQEAAKSGIADLVCFAGSTDRVHEILGGVDAFALPSLWEGLPIALLEAMGAGLPVVATSVGGIPEVVEHDVSGLLVSPADVDALACGIIRLYGDEKLSYSLGRAAIKRVEEDFTLDRLVKSYELILSDVIEEKVRWWWIGC